MDSAHARELSSAAADAARTRPLSVRSAADTSRAVRAQSTSASARLCPYARKFIRPPFRPSPLRSAVVSRVAAQEAKAAEGGDAADSVAAAAGGATRASENACRVQALASCCKCTGSRHLHSPLRKPSSTRSRAPRRLPAKQSLTPRPLPVPADVASAVRRDAASISDRLRTTRRRRRGQVAERGRIRPSFPDDTPDSLLALQRLRRTLAFRGASGVIPRVYRVPKSWQVSREEALALEDVDENLGDRDDDYDYEEEYRSEVGTAVGMDSSTEADDDDDTSLDDVDADLDDLESEIEAAMSPAPSDADTDTTVVGNSGSSWSTQYVPNELASSCDGYGSVDQTSCGDEWSSSLDAYPAESYSNEMFASYPPSLDSSTSSFSPVPTYTAGGFDPALGLLYTDGSQPPDFVSYFLRIMGIETPVLPDGRVNPAMEPVAQQAQDVGKVVDAW